MVTRSQRPAELPLDCSWDLGRGWARKISVFEVRRFTEWPKPLLWIAFLVGEFLTKAFIHWIGRSRTTPNLKARKAVSVFWPPFPLYARAFFPVVRHFFWRIPTEQALYYKNLGLYYGWRLALYLCSPSPALGLRVVVHLVTECLARIQWKGASLYWFLLRHIPSSNSIPSWPAACLLMNKDGQPASITQW